MRKLEFSIVLFATLALSCQSLSPEFVLHESRQSLDNCSVPTSLEAQVLTHFVARPWRSGAGPDSIVRALILDSTVSIGRRPIYANAAISFGVPLSSLQMSLRDSVRVHALKVIFDSINATTYPFCPHNLGSSGIFTVSTQEFNAAWERYDSDAYRQIYKQFPHALGVQAFSRVAFSTDSTLAMVYHEVRCGPLCGEGSLMIYKLVDGEWLYWRGLPLWRS